MIKKLLCILLAAIFILCTFSSCGDDDISLVMSITADPECLDPQIAETDTAKLIISNCYEGLVRLDKNQKIISGVAESWSVSDDGLVYTFKLRTNTNWQLLKAYGEVLDDENYMENFRTKVTAADFVFGLQRAVDKITDSPDADKLYCIKNAQKIHNGELDKSSLGVEAVDSHTLKITLERANPDFLRILTLPLCMPCHEEFFNATRAKYGLELKYTFCNGPFYLGRWSVDHSIVMYKNEGYVGNNAVKPTAVYLNLNKDEASIITKLNQNDYNCAFLSDAGRFSLSSDSKIRCEVTENSVYGLAFNCTDSYLQNENLRKALAILTKTGKIGKPTQATSVAGGIVPAACRYGDSSYRSSAGNLSLPTYNETTARNLWKQGLNDLGISSAEIKILCTSEYSAQMQELIQTWQRVLSTSIVAKVEVVGVQSLADSIKKDKFQIAVTEITSESATPTDMLKIFTSENAENISNHSSLEYDDLVNKIICEYSGADILTKTKEAEQMLLDTAVFIPVFNHGDYLALANETTGIYTLPVSEGVCFINGGLS